MQYSVLTSISHIEKESAIDLKDVLFTAIKTIVALKHEPTQWDDWLVQSAWSRIFATFPS